MQVGVILEIAGRRPIQFVQPFRQERPAQLMQYGVIRQVGRRANRGGRLFKEGVERRVFLGSGRLQFGLGGAAQAEGVSRTGSSVHAALFLAASRGAPSAR